MADREDTARNRTENQEGERRPSSSAPRGGSGGGERRFSSRGGDRRGGFRRGGRRRNKVCQFCADKTKTIDYKDVRLLNQFIADAGRIHSRRRTGTCAKHQRLLSKAIKRARQIALLPYTSEHGRRLRSS